jgi:hypothetical protein
VPPCASGAGKRATPPAASTSPAPPEEEVAIGRVSVTPAARGVLAAGSEIKVALGRRRRRYPALSRQRLSWRRPIPPDTTAGEGHGSIGQGVVERTGAAGGDGSFSNVALPAAVRISHRCRSSPMLAAAARGDFASGTGLFGATGVSDGGPVKSQRSRQNELSQCSGHATGRVSSPCSVLELASAGHWPLAA